MKREEATPSQKMDGPTNYLIGGIPVEFPSKAYPSQLAMMNKVIQGLKRGHNCLLESPTGSGKSLALLCSTLAWQRHEAARVAEFNAAIDAREVAKEEKEKAEKLQNRRKTNAPELQKDAPAAENSGPNTCSESNASAAANTNSQNQTSQISTFDVDDDDDFKPLVNGRRSSTAPNYPPISAGKKNSPTNTETITIQDDGPDLEMATKKLTVPKIYFGTRTHKQIAQITRELRKTTYKNSRSTIMASREHACINPVVMKLANKNEACKELLDSGNFVGGGCGFHALAKRLGNFDNLPHFGVSPGFDLEDIVNAGRNFKACPYYATRHLITHADIIFCPYNYLIDPSIRKTMSIELEGQIVIFDEGHNLEDASREAASFSLNLDEIQAAIQDAENLARTGVEPFAHEQLADFLSKIAGWISKYSTQLNQDASDYDSAGRAWTGTELMASLSEFGINEASYQRILDFFKAIMAQRDQELEKAKERGESRALVDKASIHSSTIYVCELLLRMMDYLTRDEGRQRDDFRVALQKSIKRRRVDRRAGSSTQETLTLNFWCLNPAVEFVEIKNKTRCIILTSGTLSPISSFQSELGTMMPIKLEASHVIDPEQIWAAVVSRGPQNYSLNGSYQNASTFTYLDEIGRLVQGVCSTMPHGILCFFSSYRALDSFVARWKLTRQWDRIENHKRIFIEAHGYGTTGDFEESMNLFYEINEEAATNSWSGMETGGLFLAVCRGKVSEGLDFADNNARAVICIGIPFPNYKELQVLQKRAYNDKNKSRGLLSGSQWYEVQAFRALNQALGRCIRHRHDWGAIFLVDERFSQTPRYLESLPKWIRSSIKSHSTWDLLLNNFTTFRNTMKTRFPFVPKLDMSSTNNENQTPGSSIGQKIRPTLPPFPIFSSFTKKKDVLPRKFTPAELSQKNPVLFDDEDDEYKVSKDVGMWSKDQNSQNSIPDGKHGQKDQKDDNYVGIQGRNNVGSSSGNRSNKIMETPNEDSMQCSRSQYFDASEAPLPKDWDEEGVPGMWGSPDDHIAGAMLTSDFTQLLDNGTCKPNINSENSTSLVNLVSDSKGDKTNVSSQNSTVPSSSSRRNQLKKLFF